MARRKKQNEEEPKENQDNINSESDDTFGLPEVEYQPLKRDAPQPPETPKEEPVIQEPVSEEPVKDEPVQDVEPVREEPVFEEPVREEPVFEEPVAEESVHEQNAEDSYTTHEETRTYERLPDHDRMHEEIVEEDHHEYRPSYNYMEEEKSIWPKILGFLLILLVAGGIVWYFAYYQPKLKEAEENTRREELARQEAVRKREEENRIAQLRRQEAEQRRIDSLASIPKVGNLETLSGRTGRYYVVVASAIDDDLLVDFAKKLIMNGQSCMVIPPFGKTQFSRLAVDVKDTYADAQSTADGLKGGDFGNQVWVVRY